MKSKNAAMLARKLNKEECTVESSVSILAKACRLARRIGGA